MANQPHALVITETIDSGSDRTYAVDCPGITSACRLWLPCAPCNQLSDDVLLANPVQHGVEHRWIELSWMTPTEQCYLEQHDHLPEAGDELGLPAGRHLVDFDSGDGCDLILFSLTEVDS